VLFFDPSKQELLKARQCLSAFFSALPASRIRVESKKQEEEKEGEEKQQIKKKPQIASRAQDIFESIIPTIFAVIFADKV